MTLASVFIDLAAILFIALVRKQFHYQLPQPHIGRVAVVLGLPEQVDGDFGQLDGQR